MKARKFLAMFIAALMIGTAVNFVPTITVSAKETNQQTVSASDNSDDEDYDSDDDYDYDDDYDETIYKSGDYSYTLDDHGFATIVEYRGKAKNLTIPTSLNGYKVTRVDSVLNEDTENSYTETLTIGNNVTEIGSDACSQIDNLKTVNIKKSVKKIESEAFSYNYELTKVNFEEGIKIIYASVFFDCPNLKTISLPNSVNRVGANFFGYEIGENTYFQKIKGTTITGYKGSNVEKYASSCGITFKSAGQYKPATNESNYNYEIDDNGDADITDYYGQGGDVVVPEKLNGHNVCDIDNDIFCEGVFYSIDDEDKEVIYKKFDYITSISLPENLPYFYQPYRDSVPKLNTIIINNPEFEFDECDWGYVPIYDDDGEVTDYKKISGFTIKGLTNSTAEEYAKNNNFKFVSIGEYTPIVNDTDFSYSDNGDGTAMIIGYRGRAKDVTIPATVNGLKITKIYSFCMRLQGNNTLESVTIGNNVKEIRRWAFRKCSKLKTVNIGKSVRIIEDYAFYQCPEISNVNFDEGVKAIEKNAFDNCTKLKSVSLPNSVNRIGEKSFGYGRDDDYNSYKIQGFTITGYSGSVVEKYAKDNGFNFVSLDNQDETKTTVTEITTLNTTVQPTTTTSTTMPTRNVEYPTETAMEEPTYTVPTLADTNVYTESIKLSKTKVTLLSGKSTKLTVKLTPSNANKIIWQSSNPRIATVENGVVKANKKGQATITVKTTDGTNLSAKCTVTVKQSVTSIKLNKTLITNKKGSKVKLKATVKPSKADNRIIKWQTSNKKVATVNKKGNVKITGKGYAIITCKSADGSGVNGRCVVNNSSKAKSIKLNKTKLNVKANKTAKLKATVKGKCKAVSFVSKNNKIATVNDSGVVTGIEKGKTTIIAKTMDGSKKSVKCTVTVTGHNFDSWKITKNSTCVTEGTEQRTCKSCKKTETRKIKKTSHTWESEYIVTKEPTCTDSGLAVIKCEYCDEERNPYVIPPLGHCYNESVVNKEANCTEDGLVTRVCKNCGNVEEREVNSLGHLWSSEKQVIKEPTCQEIGLKAYTCLYCKAVSEEEIIPKLDHNFSILVKDECVEPTCDSQGLYVYKCADCDAKTTKVIASLGHDWNTEPTVDIVATCQSEGKSSIHCKRCDKTKDEKTIPKTAHNFANEKVIKQATLSQDGTKSLTCKNCGFVQNKAIPKIATAKLSATSYTYDGKAKKPTITVADSNGTRLAENISYTVTGSKQGTKVNEYTVTLTFKGSYSGTKDLTYKIVPKGNAITSLTSTAKNQITVKWSKQATETTGYVLYYATKEELSDRKYVVIKNTSTLSQTVTGLTSNKKYYVAVRTIKDITSNGKTTRIYSTVSPRKTITVK